MSHVDDGLLHAYLDGELPASEAERLEAHIGECAECRARLEEERALIRRAGELLALAEPPARDVPPFRAGDRRPPVRVWWQVRFPLAWAATVALALGMGWYLGGMEPRSRSPSAALAHDSAAPSAPAGGALPLASEAKAARRPQPGGRTPVAQAKPSVENELADALARRLQEDTVDFGAAATPQRQNELPAAQVLTVDSARALLGTDPLALPDVPIESIRRIPTIGEMVVVVQQPLDSSTTIELVHRRPALLAIDAVIVSGAAEPRRERAETARAAASPVPPAAKMLVRVPGPGAAGGYARRVTRFAGGVTVEIRGRLPADSLRKLLERAQPIP